MHLKKIVNDDGDGDVDINDNDHDDDILFAQPHRSLHGIKISKVFFSCRFLKCKCKYINFGNYTARHRCSTQGKQKMWPRTTTAMLLLQ